MTRSSISRKNIPIAFLLAIGAFLIFSCRYAIGGPDEAAESATMLLESSGVEGGLIVHVECGTGELTAALRVGDALVVQGLDKSADNVSKARAHIHKKGVYGPVSAAKWDGKKLPYVDNLVNLVIDRTAMAADQDVLKEIERVLAPRGVAMIKSHVDLRQTALEASEALSSVQGWTVLVKPWPPEFDEWQQHLHGADNNAVSQDSALGPPRHYQWLDDPAWSRSHMGIATIHAVVTANGRLFAVEDRATPENPFLPGRFELIARDAFNGIELWRMSIDVWEPVTRYIKSLAIDLQRRLVAAGDVVYFTPGLTAPVTAYDAATGEIIKTYEGTEQTREIVYDRGVMYLVTGDRADAAVYDVVKPEAWRGVNLGGSDPSAPFGGTGFKSAYAPETPNKPNPRCRIAAIDTETGGTLWEKTGKDTQSYVPASLAVRGKRAVFAAGSEIICLSRQTGEEIWRAACKNSGGEAYDKTGIGEAPIGVAPPTLVLSDKAVYFGWTGGLNAGYGTVDAYDVDSGKLKWSGALSANYLRGPDVFVVDDKVWVSRDTYERIPGKQAGSRGAWRLHAGVGAYGAETGEEIKRIPQIMTGPMSHDRCYRNFITKHFYINSKTGGADFLDLDLGTEYPHHWVRSTCGMPPVPGNGMLYAGPYSCQCSIGEMIPHMKALYGEKHLKRSGQDVAVKRISRLEKGPAFGAVGDAADSALDDAWPTYRHDGMRNGSTKTPISAELKRYWKARVSTVPGPPTIADGKVFVPDVDAHTVCAFSIADGEMLWRFTADARIDSPPTYWQGLLLFGSQDGWVYCVRATDGALAWRFRDLPDRMIGAFQQVESAWPVKGSILIGKAPTAAPSGTKRAAYFAAGRSSFLDGGIRLYALDPVTGEVLARRRLYGPFAEDTGFPATGNQGSRTDVLSTDGQRLYMRHKAFNLDLSDAALRGRHMIASAGFLQGDPQHRTYWIFDTGFRGVTRAANSGDIMVSNGEVTYGIEGFPVHRHSYFDARVKGYRLTAVAPLLNQDVSSATAAKAQVVWRQDVPVTGKAMALAGDTLLVGGCQIFFPPDHPVEKYEAAYAGKLGGILWLASAEDGRKLAEYKLDAVPAWDGMAVAYGKAIVSLDDGTIVCFGPDK